jgi:hypothetical protein
LAVLLVSGWSGSSAKANVLKRGKLGAHHFLLDGMHQEATEEARFRLGRLLVLLSFGPMLCKRSSQENYLMTNSHKVTL